jgi:F0F1-type ATP synthase epsilon subunit
VVKAGEFQLVVRTPHEVAVQTVARAARLLTESGHVGLRPGAESTVLAVEPGVVHVKPVGQDSPRRLFIGTAGGLLTYDQNIATLLTPLAVAGEDEPTIVDQLDQLMQCPNSEWDARHAFNKLERHILREIRREQNEGGAQRLEQPL